MVNSAGKRVRKKNRGKKKFYRVNWQISAPKLRLIDEEGKQIGIFSLQQAREKAQEKGLDLVEIVPQANPPIVKLIDFAKFKYQQEKKERQERKKQKGGVKEVRFTPFIEEADFKVRIKRLTNFLKQEHRVRVVIKFLGRQITQKGFGYQLIEKIQEEVKEWGEKEGEPKLTGKRLIVFFKPNKHHEEKKENQKIS